LALSYERPPRAPQRVPRRDPVRRGLNRTTDPSTRRLCAFSFRSCTRRRPTGRLCTPPCARVRAPAAPRPKRRSERGGGQGSGRRGRVFWCFGVLVYSTEQRLACLRAPWPGGRARGAWCAARQASARRATNASNARALHSSDAGPSLHMVAMIASARPSGHLPPPRAEPRGAGGVGAGLPPH
jgi:hypothetical protein